MLTGLLRRPFLGLFFMLAVVAAAVVAWSLLPGAQLRLAMAEDGWVEMGTAWAYFGLGAAFWFWRDRRGADPAWPALSVMLLAFGARELDWHKAFTEKSVLKMSFFFGAAPLLHKLVALAVLVPVAVACGYLVLRFTVPVCRAAWRRHPAAVTAVVYAVGMVLAKMLDRSVNIYVEDFGGTVSESVRVLASVLEETSELGLSLLPLLGLLQYRAASPLRGLRFRG